MQQTATCDLTWDWQHGGTRSSAGEVVLVWHETDGGWDSGDIKTTAVGANSWLKPGGNQDTLAANHADNSLGVPITTISEGGRYELELWHYDDPDISRLALEVRSATNDHDTTWSPWKRFSTEVGRYKLAIQEQSEYDLYMNSGAIVGCSDPIVLYNCFGGDPGRWKQVNRH